MPARATGGPAYRAPDDPAGPFDCFVQILPIQLDPHEIYAEQRTGDRGAAESQEWIGDDAEACQPVEAEAVVGQPDRERSRMRPVCFPALNRVVREEPGIAAASPPATCRLPACDIRLILVRHPQRQAVQGVCPDGEK